MLDIDGARQSGSGTIVRHAVALSSLLGEPVRVFNARKRRRSPGLRPQHVMSVRACAAMCGAMTDGVAVDSTEFTFRPGAGIAGGAYEWEIGTAGSTTMLAYSVLPLACFADRPVRARIEGGVFQDSAPSPHHMHHVLGALLRRMGATLRLEVKRPGYVPRGAGVVQLTVTPVVHELAALRLMQPGVTREVRGVALASHLAERRVSDRMASACEAQLLAAGLSPVIERMEDTTAAHAGANLAIWAESATGCVLGADRAGAFRRSSEAIGAFVAQAFLHDLRTGATVDRHVADQLVLFAALAHGRSHYIVPHETDHLTTNLWLIQQFGARGIIEKREVVIDGLGHTRAERSEGGRVRQPSPTG